ncbi:MAG: hypothetical protein ICCCNLDF_03223 [Planctomycetes bacterium]|nr:hypothetical protein [Planctomycetota bacterium]
MRVILASLALSVMANLLILGPEGMPEPSAGSYQIKSDFHSATVQLKIQGHYLAAEFTVEGPLQPDDSFAQLAIEIKRGDQPVRSFCYLPAATHTRSMALQKTDEGWSSDREASDWVCGVLGEQRGDRWGGMVWIDTKAMGAGLTEVWHVSFRVESDGEVSCSPQGAMLQGESHLVDLAKLPTSLVENVHPTVAARETAKRVLTTLEQIGDIDEAGKKYNAVLTALEQDPNDPALLAMLLDVVPSSQTGAEASDELSAAVRRALKSYPGWFHAHSMQVAILQSGGKRAEACDYFLKTRAAIPRTPASSWKSFFLHGCDALSEQRRWKDLIECLNGLLDEDFATSSMKWGIRRYAERLLGVGQTDAATSLRDRLLRCIEAADSTVELKVWWLEVLAANGNYLAAQEELELVWKLDGLEEDAKLQWRVAEVCVSLAGTTCDPPEAVELCKRLKETCPDELKPALHKALDRYLEVCLAAEADWKEELRFRQEDAGRQNPRVRVQTERGEIVIELFEDDAPNTVANFVKLVRDGFYDGRSIYRREGAWLVQGGGKDDDPSGIEEWSIRNEDNRRQHWRGTIAMARRQDKETANTHFFITIGNTPGSLDLSTDWVVFGRVVEGLERAQCLQKGDRITKATAEKLRDHNYEPERIPFEEK